MAEALGTIASILQVLDTVSKTWEHIQDFRNAPQEERQIRIEMGYLDFTLKKLQQQIHQQTTLNPPTPPINLNPFGPQINPNPSRPQTPPKPSIQWIQEMNKPLATFEGMMKEFELKLGDLSTITTFKRQVKWSLGGKKEAAEYLAKFEQFKSLLNTWLLVDLGDMSHQQSDLLQSVKSGVTNLNNTILDQQHAAERTQIMDWFSPVNFFQQHADIASARQQGTGAWLMMDPRFQEWKNELGRTLWCHGIPGAGKTVSASLVVDHLSQGTAARTACVYLNHKETKIQTPANLLASIWRQLVIGRRDISDVKTLYQKHLEKQTTPSLAEIENIVHSEIGISKVYIVVDAVDEYPEDLRQILLPALAAMGPTCNLMMTSRPHITPSPAFQNIKFLEIHAHVDDIQAYVNMEIQKSSPLSKCVQKQPALMEEIHARISGRADGMFLLAKLHMKALAEQRTPKQVRTALHNLPETLAETYADAMRRIDTQSKGDRQIAQAVLTWVTHAKQILSVADLRVALAIEPGAKELDDDDLLDIETILGVCAGLIIVDEHLSVVRLVHYTTQEYMDRNSLQHFPRAQIKITQSLLTFINFDSVWNFITGYDDDDVYDMKLPPLLEYCQYCLTHAAREPETDPEVQNMLLKFIHQIPFCMRFAQRHWYQWHTLYDASPLYVAATTNLLDIGCVLIGEGQYSEDMARELASAAARGHCDMVRLLIGSGANVNSQNREYGNALQAAVYHGNREALQVLIEHGADVNAQGGKYGNALQAAVHREHKEVVHLLIEHGADVNAQGGKYGNALQAAVHREHKEVVHLLIEHGADVNAQGGKYGNALQAAVHREHKEVVHLLIEHGADVNAQGGKYGNALQAAVMMTQKEVVQLLIEHGADVNAWHQMHGNALHAAALKGWEEVVQLLIEHVANVNAMGGKYGNALQAAAVNGEREVIQLLIDRGANVNAQGGEYGNALQAALVKGHKEVVQLLIEHGADIQGGEYGNALQTAAVAGHKEIVQLLIEHGADVNTQGAEYGNALQAAGLYGHKEIVRVLIDNDADVNAQGGYYGTALWGAAVMGQKEIVQLLIEHGANAETGPHGNTFQSAAVRGHQEIVQLLMEHGANVIAQCEGYENALQTAAVTGHKEIVHLLIDHGANVNAQGGEYGNALQAAALYGLEEIVQLLIEHGADVNAQGGKYGNALQAAVHREHKEVVHLLIEHGADVNAQGGKYGNALQAAVVKGRKEVVQLLIEHGAYVDAQGGEYGNALQAAVVKGHKEVVQLLIEYGANVDAQGGEYHNS
ncbi:ankyrin repeat-containing domain protein, partial [Mycena filopes]